MDGKDGRMAYDAKKRTAKETGGARQRKPKHMAKRSRTAKDFFLPSTFEKMHGKDCSITGGLRLC
jgi:hypothetical protein